MSILKMLSFLLLIGLASSSSYLHEIGPFKLRFTMNRFHFKLLGSNLTDKAGQLTLQQNERTRNFLNLNSLNVSAHATRNLDSLKIFKIDQKNLDILIVDGSLLKPGDKHFIHVYLFDAYKRYVPTSCTVQIDIMDNLNKNPPVFDKNLYQGQIVENNAPNTLVVKVTARDENDFGRNSHITYHFVNPNSIPAFQIESDTGEIYAKKVLNREEQEFYNFTVMALDNGVDIRHNSLVLVNIRVLAEANKSPRFSKAEYVLSLSENSDVTQRPVVLRVNALDNDNGTNLVYSLAGSLNDMNTFEIEPKTGVVRLVSKLNYELKSQYKLSIVARDLSQPPRATYAEMNVNIEPSKPNPPIFSAPFYEFILYENAVVGQFVGSVSAYDKSSSAIFNTSIIYSLKNESEIPFRIDPNNGTISTSSKIYKNYKRYGYEFSAVASLNIGKFISKSTVKIKIKILDINDLVPELEQSVYHINISEVSTVGLPILTLNTRNSNDEDALLDYSIELGNENEIFSLIKQGNSRAFLTTQRSNLNYKQKSSYELTVKVMDQDGLYSTSLIKASVIPADIYSPRFSKGIYKFQVYENSELNTFIGQILAQIPSGQDYENLVYRIITVQGTASQAINDHTSDYNLNYKTGNLYVATNRLDREKYDSITLYVTANVGKFVDHAIIQIEIIDVNDNAPIFTRAFYEAKVFQDDDYNSYLLRVEATDKDLDKNGIIKYSIKEPTTYVFIDSSSGVIRLNKKLNHDLNLTLIAHDSGEPSLSSETHVYIKSMNSVHLAPQFDRDIFEFNLLENLPASTVVGEVKARDPDLGHRANIVYKILDNYELFELKPSGTYNSVLLVTKFVSDYETKNSGLIELKIRAYSSSSASSVFTDCLIRVRMQNLSDKKPVVPNPIRIIFNNYKNYFLTPNSAFIPVYDSDPTNNLTFNLLDSIGKQVVDLDPLSGKMVFKPILNSNNLINVSFLVGIDDGIHQTITTCELTVLMLSDNLVSDSVTLSLSNVDSNIFLDYLYPDFTQLLLNILPKSQMSNIHIFNLANTSFGLNISLAISYDYEKDLFMPNNILKQLVYAHSDVIEKTLHISKLIIYEDSSCGIEPCFNYQSCINNVKVDTRNNEFLHAEHNQFRSISIKHDFECKCPHGFTGKNSSVVCDLEINLCYSNPCGNNGVCVSLESSFMCLCDEGFTGRFCEFNLNTIKCCADQEIGGDLVPSTPHSFAMNSSNVDKCAAAHSPLNFWVIDGDGQVSASNFICKSSSRCKNLILGGIVCDKCGNDKSAHSDKSFYNKFCELRAKHFPKNKNAFMTLPGIQNRFRFKIRLTFATVKSTGYLFHNARLNMLNSDVDVNDFISLRIQKGMLLLEYSFGSLLSNQVVISNISVADGKWRTVVLNYEDYEFTLSLDNDNNPEINACELAFNKDRNDNSLIDCFRVKSTYRLPTKCSSQIETCFRYFDLNGPLILGRQSSLGFVTKHLTSDEQAENYEGCISDLYINEKLIDLNGEAMSDHNTQIGCSMKSNKHCEAKTECTKCQQIWGDRYKCNKKSLNSNSHIYSLNSTSYLTLKDIKLDNRNGFRTEFFVRLSENDHFYRNGSVIIANFEVYSNTNSQKLDAYFLNYNLRLNEIELINGQDILFRLATDLDDGFWNKLKLQFVNNRLYIAVNNYLKASAEFSFQDSFMKSFIGGSPNRKQSGIVGCVKKLDGRLLLLRESVDISKNCRIEQSPRISTEICDQICFNNATCNKKNNHITCHCRDGFKGKYCQFEQKRANTLVGNNNSCPAKWWGTEPGICGPCKCDESKNFSPDCDKTNGACQCKPKFYKRVNQVTGEATCVPCNCYLEGSESLQCEQITGQCKCLSGAGITGRRCDQCVSPFAEMTNGYECRQLSSSECPKAFMFNTWWPRTKFDNYASADCPKGSTGQAYRYCSERTGWLMKVDLSNCQSKKLLDSQLYKWSSLLLSNGSLLNSYQALQIAEDLNEITQRADESDELSYESKYVFKSFLATSLESLYAKDLVVIKNLTMSIIQFEIDNAPSFLYIQDKYFLRNIFSTLNRILNKKYEPKLQQLRNSELMELKNQTEPSDFKFTDLFICLDKYLSILVQYSQHHSNLNMNIDFNNFKLSLDKIIGQSYSESTNPLVNFKLITADDSKDKKLAYIILDTLASNLPSKLSIGSMKANTPIKYHIDEFIAVSNVLMVNIQHQIHEKEQEPNKSLYIVIDFVLSNIFPAAYDENYKNLKIAPNSNYYCVYLDVETQSWSTKGAKLISYNYETNTVKCSYDHFSIYSVVTSTNGLSNSNSQPIQFSLITYILIPIAFIILFIICVILFFIKRHATLLTQIYLNLTLNMLALQVIFIFGINANSSQILCKFLAVVQHYLQISSYVWILIVFLHLYRMLTELRDINKTGSSLPVFYYIIAVAIPGIIVSLTFGIKEDIYTNFSLFSNLYDSSSGSQSFANFYLSSVYCWLCVTNYYEIIYVFLLPIIIILISILILMVLCLNECRRTTFKKSDVPIVKQNILTCLSIIVFQAILTAFLLMLVYTATSSNLIQEFTIYQYLYLSASIVYSIQLFVVLFIFDSTNKEYVIKLKNSYLNKTVLNESLDTSKLNLYKRSPQALKSNLTDDSNAAININDLGVDVLANINQQVFKPNSKYMLDYRDLQAHTNSVSTTTTSGTLDNLDDCELQANYLKYQWADMGQSGSNAYMSHLANTTNTDSTINDSEFYSNRFHIDFNQPQNEKTDIIRESDVIDIGEVLKSRNMTTSQNQFGQNFVDDSEDIMMPVDFKNKNKMYDQCNPSSADDDTMFGQNYIQQFNNGRIQNELTKCYNSDAIQQHILSKKNPSLSLFWPNTVAECDTSYLEGSVMLSPAKLQNQLETSTDPEVPINNTLTRNFHKNDSYNSNTTSNSTSYSTSTSSLILNSNSLEQVAPANTNLPTKNTLNPSSNAVLILTHTGSATSSDNESGNETRV